MTRPELEEVTAYVAARLGSLLSAPQRARLEEAILSRYPGRPAAQVTAHLGSPAGAVDLHQLMGTVSVHKTSLFRELGALQALSRQVLPRLATLGRPVEAWSAGCATGEEVATLLILLAEAGVARPRVLGSDVSAAVLERAAALTFDEAQLGQVPAGLRQRAFEPLLGASTLRPTLKAGARFVQHNLMDVPYPGPEEGFDLILCRNVLMYLTEAAAREVLERLGARLRPGGVLVLGAAEPLLQRVEGLQVERVDDVSFHRRPLEIPAPAPAARATLPAPPQVPAPVPAPQEAAVSGEALFEALLAAPGEGDLEAALRQVLYLSPGLAAARYSLGLLLEARGEARLAAQEFRRALAAVEAAPLVDTGFFIGGERLAQACRTALSRLPGG